VNESIEYLAPVILTCMAIGIICFVLVAYERWRRFPAPAAWESKYGRVRRR
jgi:hypothetical protein